jgi:hypothetical protein
LVGAADLQGVLSGPAAGGGLLGWKWVRSLIAQSA